MKEYYCRIQWFSLVFILFFFLACAPKPISKASEPKPASDPLAEKAGWEAEWEKTIEEARKEGKVAVQLSAGFVPMRDEIGKKIRSKYGIEPQWITGRATEMAEKIIREYRAGIYAVDLYMSGPTSILGLLKPENILAPIEPALILPEVTDAKLWWGAKLNFLDKDKLVLSFHAYPSEGLAYNADYVYKDDLQSYSDLLNPRWKGKIVMSDPTIGGSGNMWVSMILEIKGQEYLKELARQDLMFTRDLRLMLEWMARGKYLIGVGVGPLIEEFRKAGVPLDLHTPKEGSVISGGFGSLALYKNAPHPNAAKIFINWNLSKEGQLLLSKGTDRQSARTDLPTDFLKETRQEGARYVDLRTEEYQLKIQKNQQIAQDIFKIHR